MGRGVPLRASQRFRFGFGLIAGEGRSLTFGHTGDFEQQALKFSHTGCQQESKYMRCSHWAPFRLLSHGSLRADYPK